MLILTRFEQKTLKSCNNACWALGEMVIKLQPDTLKQGGVAGTKQIHCCTGTPALNVCVHSPIPVVLSCLCREHR